MLSNDVFYLLIFAFLGAVWFNLDAAFGAGVYGWWFSMTHKDKLPPGVRQGYIYERKAKTRFYAAIALASAEYLLFAHWMSFGPLAKLSVWVFGIVATFVGFYLGPVLHVIWRKKDAVLEKIDEVESGRVNLKDEARETVNDLRREVQGALSGAAGKLSDAVTDAVKGVAEHLPHAGKQDSQGSPSPVNQAEMPAPSAAETLENLMTEAAGQVPAAGQPEAAVPPQPEEDPAAAARRKLREFSDV
jgi:hypothetical protein